MNSKKRIKRIVLCHLALGLTGAASFLPTASWGQQNGLDTSAPLPTPNQEGSRQDLWAGAGSAPTDAPLADDGFYDRYLKGRLELGTRSVYRKFTNSDSGAMGKGQGEGTFLGSIYAVNEDQNELPVQPFVTYYFTKYIGLELAYDSLTAKTVAYSDGASKTDGNIVLAGPTLSLMGRYPNQTPFTPYMGLGIGIFHGDFNPDAAWALGYTNPVVYKSLGSPSTLDGGYSREMIIDDTVALLLTAGTAYRVYRNWSVDLSVQYMKADVDAVFKSFQDGASFVNEPGKFPLSNVTLRAGLVYTF